MNACPRCVFRVRYIGADTHWCRLTGIHIEGQIVKLHDGSLHERPHEPAPDWCPGMTEKTDDQ